MPTIGVERLETSVGVKPTSTGLQPVRLSEDEAMEQPRGIEPRSPRWQRGVLPLDMMAAWSGVRDSNPSRWLGRPVAHLEQTPQAQLTVESSSTSLRSRRTESNRARLHTTQVLHLGATTAWWTGRESNPHPLLARQGFSR